MTLKPLDVFGWSNKERNYDVLINTLNRHKGKRIIVTVEEEVKECCEKWRGHTITETDDGRATWRHSGFEIKHCPECGEKL